LIDFTTVGVGGVDVAGVDVGGVDVGGEGVVVVADEPVVPLAPDDAELVAEAEPLVAEEAVVVVDETAVVPEEVAVVPEDAPPAVVTLVVPEVVETLEPPVVEEELELPVVDALAVDCDASSPEQASSVSTDMAKIITTAARFPIKTSFSQSVQLKTPPRDACLSCEGSYLQAGCVYR
jgi:hypothetical protein